MFGDHVNQLVNCIGWTNLFQDQIVKQNETRVYQILNDFNAFFFFVSDLFPIEQDWEGEIFGLAIDLGQGSFADCLDVWDG